VSHFGLEFGIPFSVTTVSATELQPGINDVVGTWKGIAVGVTEEFIRLENNNIKDAIAASEMQMVITQATKDFCTAVFKWKKPETKKIKHNGSKYPFKGNWNSICLYEEKENKLIFQGGEVTMTCDFSENLFKDRKKLDCYYLRSNFDDYGVYKFHLTKIDYFN